MARPTSTPCKPPAPACAGWKRSAAGTTFARSFRQLPGSLQEQSGHAAALLHGRLPGYVGMCLAPGEVGPISPDAWRLDLDALADHVQALSITNSAVVPDSNGWSRTPATLTEGLADWTDLLDEVTQRGLDVFAILDGRYSQGAVWRHDADGGTRFAYVASGRSAPGPSQHLGAKPVRRQSNKPRRWYRPL